MGCFVLGLSDVLVDPWSLERLESPNGLQSRCSDKALLQA